MVSVDEVRWAEEVRSNEAASLNDCVRAAEIFSQVPVFPYHPARFTSPTDPAHVLLERLLARSDLDGRAIEAIADETLPSLGNSWFISDMLGAVASHPNCPAHVLRAIAERALFPYELANNPSCPADVLERLACSADAKIRHWVALNPSAPASLTGRLAKDASNWVQAGVIVGRRRAQERT